MTLFSSVLTSYSTKVNGQVIDASDVNNLQTDVQQIEAILGVDGANSVVGTYAYFVKSPASDGGGHVQAANRGGTGQTQFNQGDILVAQSSSVLSKLAVGSDTQVLTADSTQATGVKWSNSGFNKINVNASTLGVGDGAETSVYSVTIPGSTLGTASAPNALRATTFINDFTLSNAMTFRVQYGGQRLSSIIVGQSGATGSVRGQVVHTIMASTASLQVHVLDLQLTAQPTGVKFENMTLIPDSPARTSVVSFRAITNTTSSVESSANQVLGLTISGSSGVVATIGGRIIEKIN